ncbi:hypothetical protein J4Q44_G00362190 [Coregonus suidteri]|uniref:Uncharacterized protein n=1 Tax=Coregonus suidteri TaxID=861788 RepID=A0AAN8KMV3_9TELE
MRKSLSNNCNFYGGISATGYFEARAPFLRRMGCLGQLPISPVTTALVPSYSILTLLGLFNDRSMCCMNATSTARVSSCPDFPPERRDSFK